MAQAYGTTTFILATTPGEEGAVLRHRRRVAKASRDRDDPGVGQLWQPHSLKRIPAHPVVQAELAMASSTASI